MKAIYIQEHGALEARQKLHREQCVEAATCSGPLIAVRPLVSVRYY
jgi:hypothetical protein